MADHSKGGLSRKVQKTLTRTKAKFLINLGKADKTSDEQFDVHVAQLDKQQEVGHRFQKELRNYINSTRGLLNASKNLYAAVLDTYETEWMKDDTVKQSLESMELMWVDYQQKLQEKVQDPLNTYMSHIPQLKARISKRGRKLVDFDNARHSVEVAQNAKKKDEHKIIKAKEDHEEAKKIYTELNEQLNYDLPEFYNSRINFFGSTFANLFSADNLFHSELATLTGKLNDVSQALADEYEGHAFVPSRPLSKTISKENNDEGMVNNTENGDHHTNGNSGYDSSSPVVTPTKPPMVNGMGSDDEENSTAPASPVYANEVSFKATEALTPQETEGGAEAGASATPKKLEEEFVKAAEETEESGKEQVADAVATVTESAPQVVDTVTEEKPAENEDKAPDDAPDYPPPAIPSEPPPSLEEAPSTNEPVMTMKEEESLPAEQPSSPVYEPVSVSASLATETTTDTQDDNLYQVPKSNEPVSQQSEDVSPEGTLYIVKATHFYKGEDEDELTFEVGQKIFVIPFDDPEEQDDGWLMGLMRDSNGQETKGVFPANFTQQV